MFYWRTGARSLENARIAKPELLLVQNSRKELTGTLQSLQDPAVFARKQAQRDAGLNTYPDAGGSLRLSCGTFKGYTEDGAAVPASTTMGGLLSYAAQRNDQPPYQPSPSWVKAKNRIQADMPFDFVCTADAAVGGCSGSPGINKSGELVGLVFDGNIQSLGNHHAYTDKQACAVAVHSEAIIEALRHIYGDNALAAELLSSHAR